MKDLVVDTEKNKEPSWIKYIKKRIERKKNFLCFISGETGSGKSYSGLSICLMLDKEFAPDRIVTDMKQLMKLVNSKKLKSGSCILWDEAGINASSREWQSLTNKLINYLLQTFRHRRFILIFTSPYMDFVDASIRKLFHAEFEMMSINEKESTAKVKPMLIQYNSRKRKFYYKYLRVKAKHHSAAALKKWNIPKPPDWLVDEYELIKSKFTTDLNKSIEEQLNALDNQAQQKNQPLTEIQKTIFDLMTEYNDVDKVAKELGVHKTTIYFHISQARKKNWVITSPESKIKGTGVLGE